MPRSEVRSYQAASYRFTVRGDPSVEAVVHSFLVQFHSGSAGEEAVPTYDVVRRPEASHTYSLFIGDREVVTEAPLSASVDRLLWEVSQAAVEESGNRLAFHAGVVSLDGKAMLLPAPPGSGKTTLVGGLVRAGCSYLSDELAQIDPATTEVLPFPRALAFLPDALELFEGLSGRLPPELGDLTGQKLHVRPDDLRPDSIPTYPSQVRVIVFPSYARDSPTRLEPISRAEAVASLMANSFNFVRLGAPALELIGRLVSGAVAFRLASSDLHEAVEVTMSLLEAVDQPG